MIRKHGIRQILSTFVGSLSVMCSGATYVWVNPVMNQFESDESPVKMTDDEISWMVAVIEVGDLVATLPSGYLADKFGRKAVLVVTGPLIAFTWLLVQFTSSFYVLLIARLLQGLAVGVTFTLMPIYIGEISDKRVRGMACTMVQTMWYVGILYAFAAVPRLSYTSGINIVCLLPSLVFAVLFAFCPETPQYYLLKGDLEKAEKAFNWLQGEVMAENQLEAIVKTEGSKERMPWTEIFTEKKPRKSLFIVAVVTATNVIGVPAVLSYSTKTFARITDRDSSYYTMLMGCLTLVSSLISAFLVDRLGRRPLLLFSTTACTVTLLTAGTVSMFDGGSGLFSVWCVIMYPPLMSIGPGTLTYTLMAELFSNRYRGVGASIIILLAALFTFIGLKLYGFIENEAGLSTILLILGAISGFSFIIIYILVPETKGKTFDEIQQLL